MIGEERDGRSADLTTREATVADVPAVAELFAAYRVFYGRTRDVGLAATFLLERLTRRESRVFVAEAAAAARPARLCAFAQVYASFSSVDAAPIWVLNDLFVADEHRGRGVGRHLLRRVHDVAREHGVFRIELETALSNGRARSLYESLGYTAEAGYVHYSLRIET